MNFEIKAWHLPDNADVVVVIIVECDGGRPIWAIASRSRQRTAGSCYSFESGRLNASPDSDRLVEICRRMQSAR